MGYGRVTSAARPGRGGVERWLGGVPGSAGLASAGEIGALTVRVVRVAITPPFPWWRDAVVEFSIALRRCLIPLVISMITFATGIAVLFVGQIVNTLGTSDRLAGGLVIGFTREPSEWVTAMIFAGVAGSAMTADLGARRIREELDALQVLGVDHIKSLVVPRVVAMILVAPVLGLICLFVSQAMDYILIPIFYPSVSYASEIEVMKNFLFTVYFLVLVIKLPIVGAFVGIISCYKGLSAKGGAEGVGRAVNQAVVLMFLGLWLLNSLLNLAYLSQFPIVQGLRG
jgi:phospholipid/cholesterol/gamma-HCH transport system permease protein